MKAFGINPTENQLDDIMNHIDTDGDGVITLKEYKRVVHEVFGENELFSVKTDDLEYSRGLLINEKSYEWIRVFKVNFGRVRVF